MTREGLLSRKENLHPELSRWLSPGIHGEIDLIHPLVFGRPYRESENAIYNYLYASQQEKLLDAERSHDWHKYVFTHEKPCHIYAFKKLVDKLGNREYWEVLAAMWTKSENIYEFKRDWKKLLSSNRPERA